jgi:hypothetical protein
LNQAEIWEKNLLSSSRAFSLSTSMDNSIAIAIQKKATKFNKFYLIDLVTK